MAADRAELIVAAFRHRPALYQDQVVVDEVRDDVDVVLDGVELLAEVLVHVETEYAEQLLGEILELDTEVQT